MSILVKEVHDYDFNDLLYNCCGGAVDVLKEIEKHDKEEAFIRFLECVFEDEVDMTELNDFIAFEDDYIFNTLEIKWGVYEDEDDET